MEYLLDESGCQQLVDLLHDRSAPLLIEATQSLLHRFGASSDIQGVLSDFPQDARLTEGLHANM
jgi:hypothetical protein